MNWIDSILGFMQRHEAEMLLVLSALDFCLLLLNLYLLAKTGKLARTSKSALAAVAESPVVETSGLNDRLGKAEMAVMSLHESHSVLDKRLSKSIQRVGLVRFDAFPDVGGEQSFALALLDMEMNGVVLSSLYGRSDSRLYAKEISEGCSHHTLSDEEKEAIRRAGNSTD